MATPSARNAGRTDAFSAARGVGLIALAVIVGFILFQIVDDPGSSSSNGGDGGGGDPTDVTAETVPEGGTTDVRPPAQVRVAVLNAGQPAGSASNKTNQLRPAGYNLLTPGDSTPRTGTAVQCLTGFEAEADALSLAVGEGATVEPFPEPVPAGAENADCIVLLGQ